MSEYTPTTEEVLDGYMTLRAQDGKSPEERLLIGIKALGEFERWHAAEVRKAMAEAWDEGHSDGQHNEHEWREGRQITNPYRDPGGQQ